MEERGLEGRLDYKFEYNYYSLFLALEIDTNCWNLWSKSEFKATALKQFDIMILL
jgi:hypothetical protein